MIGLSMGVKALLTVPWFLLSLTPVGLGDFGAIWWLRGLSSALPEGVAQAQQRAAIKPNASSVFIEIVKQNGFLSLCEARCQQQLGSVYGWLCEFNA